MTYATSGQTALAADANIAVAKGVSHAERLTDSTAASAAQGVLRIDDYPMRTGYRYRVYTSSLLLTSSIAADVCTARLSFTIDGSTPVTGSTLFAMHNSPAIPATANGVGCMLCRTYVPATDLMFSVLLWTQRLSGTGNARLLTASNVIPISIDIDDLGPDTGNVGTSL